MKIAGIHAIEELLKTGKPIEKVFILRNTESAVLKQLAGIFRRKGIPVQYVPKQKLNTLFQGTHQGIIAIVSEFSYTDMEKMVQDAFNQTDTPVFLLLDGITDTRNFGAVLRSAAAFEVNGIIVPAHHSAPLNKEVVKTSAGGIFKIPISRVNHLADALFYLKSYQVEIIAATEKSHTYLEQFTFSKPVGLIMGNEHKGISNRLIALSDFKLKINISTQMDSLNVSVATGIFLYEIHKQLKLK